MICFPGAKINLGLHVIGKRPDGYHDIETLMYPVSFFDVLEFIQSDELKLYLHGLEVEGKLNENTLIRTWQFFRQHYEIPPVEIQLLKIIPPGSGLGGGSADAGFFIVALNEIFKLGITNNRMKSIAATIGSDCSFFIGNEPAIAQGRGDIIEPCSFSLAGKFIVLVFPDIPIPTKLAYSVIKPSHPKKSIREIVSQPIQSWKEELRNDFEKPIFERHPEIKKIKEELYHAGASYASMTGSGSAVYGIFEKEIATDEIPINARCWSTCL